MATVALTASKVAAHGHGEACGCVAMEPDTAFTIDCSDTATMMQAFNDLVANSCNASATACEQTSCKRDYFIIQSHHDFCDHDQVPEAIEDGLHDFEGVCEDCIIRRQYNPSLPQCPSITCSDPTEANNAYADLTDASNGCSSDCSAAVCRDAYQVIRAYHDSCDEDDISTMIETGIHDFEDVCEQQGCNIVSKAFDPNTCGAADLVVNALLLSAVVALTRLF